MKSEELFELSLEMIAELQHEIIKSDVLDCGPRLELVEQCIYISFEYRVGMNRLLSMGLPIQAMVLLRAQYEAVVRAYWLLFIASNYQISNFKKYHLKQLNSFVHTGKQSFTRDIMGFKGEMLLTLMRQSNNLITIAAKIILKHTVPDKQKVIHYLIEKCRQCFYLDADVELAVRARVEKYFE
ncbi:DUF6988 family protein [Acinetobacter radioresistens]|uniref:DUF6988 family protein n=1 Tax=Acinetobacter radioresistens TaxID=40216 RepID=UPI00254B2DAA|nr:hypothetical protein [Acinetobacter radioresistens]MDK8754441.1 hypothetical protein [Acinetobacter radioresistens]